MKLNPGVIPATGNHGISKGGQVSGEPGDSAGWVRILTTPGIPWNR